MRRRLWRSPSVQPGAHAARRGAFLVVGALCLIALLTVVAFAVDMGVLSLTKTRMQNATDSGALAAALEITNAITTAGANVQDVFTYAKAQAAAKAASVAELNGVYVNPSVDVAFGRRYKDAAGNYTIDWNAAADQVNAVKVIARRDSDDKKAQDAKVPGLFSSVFSTAGTTLRAESVSYIEPRDMVVVHDFSRSMNFDSYFNDEQSTTLPQASIEANLQIVWNDLQPLNIGSMTYEPQYMSKTQSNTGASATVTFKGTSVAATTNTKFKSVKLYFTNGATQTFAISNETTTTGNWAGTGGNAGKRINKVDLTIRKVGSTTQSWTLANYSYDTTSILAAFGLSSLPYPYASGSWSDYVSFVQTNGGLAKYNYQDMYGGKTYLCYLMRQKSSYNETQDLWKTRHYPFHAIKEGHELLCDYLTQLGFDDHLGMVSYDASHRVETTINDPGNPDMPSVNIAATPLTNDHAAVKKLMHYKQASHYSDSTNMAGGMKSAVQLLDQHKRDGSRPAIILMTDGNGNTLDSGESSNLPGGWNWNALFDYDGDGVGDYSTSNSSAKCTLKYVKQAVDKGYTVHAISVGVDADRDLLKAVAWLGGGYYIDVPGGQSVSDIEADVKAAFVKIAAAVPPARLVKPE